MPLLKPPPFVACEGHGHVFGQRGAIDCIAVHFAGFSAVDRVSAKAVFHDERIIAEPTGHAVGTCAACNCIVTNFAIKHVIRCGPCDCVCASATEHGDGRVCCGSVNDIVTTLQIDGFDLCKGRRGCPICDSAGLVASQNSGRIDVLG